MNFGPCKLIWHPKNKQMVLEFMPDLTQLIIDVEVKPYHLDPFFLKKVLGREPTPDEKKIEISYTTSMRLECEFKNPDYGEQIAARFIKRMSKGMKPKQLLLIPNYGLAAKKDSMEFYRAQLYSIAPQKIVFLILPTDDTGERTRPGL